MPITKSLLTMSPDELNAFVTTRREARSLIKLNAKKRAPKSPLNKLSKELGLSKLEIVRRLKKELGI